MRRFLILVLVFVAVFAVSCSKKKSHEEKGYVEEVSKEVSAEDGGTVESSDGKTSIEIPGGALENDTVITMRIFDAEGYKGTDGKDVVTKVVEFEPSGTKFKKPVIITMAAEEAVEGKTLTAAVFKEAENKWSYSESGAYALLQGKDAAGDPIMTTAAGDPIMLNAAGDPIMTNAAGDPIMMSAAGDPIMLASAGDPIMTSAAGDPIMNAAAGDPIMMTTGHFTAYTFIALEPREPVEIDDSDDTDGETDDDEPAETDDDEPVAETDDDEPADDTDTPENDEDLIPEPEPVYSEVICTGSRSCVNDSMNVEMSDDDNLGYTRDAAAKGTASFECPGVNDEFYGQDANYISRKSCVPQSFERLPKAAANADEEIYQEIKDNVTGLVWLYTGARGSFAAMSDLCSGLTYDGRTWRLPTPKEFLSIVDSDGGEVALRKLYFKELAQSSDEGAGSSFWTSEESLYFYNDGSIMTTDQGSENAVMCVSGDEYGKPGAYTSETVNGEEAIRDSSTKLLWQKSFVSGKNWKEALEYCENLEYAGYSDWRLPNKNELATLLDYSKIPSSEPGSEDPTGEYPEESDDGETSDEGETDDGDTSDDGDYPVTEHVIVSSFPGMTANVFVSSTPRISTGYSSEIQPWAVSMYEGRVDYVLSDEEGGEGPVRSVRGLSGTRFSVRCVRSDLTAAPADGIPECDEKIGYTPCKNGNTVWSPKMMLSSNTGVEESGDGTTWQEIAESCRRLTVNGKRQWRIPSIDELRTLVTADKLKTGGTCGVTTACIESSCYDQAACTLENEAAFESKLRDYGTLVSGDGEEGMWAIYTDYGALSEFFSANGVIARCVLDETLPDYEFPYTQDIEEDGHILWSQVSDDYMTFSEAAEYCSGLSEEGAENSWRVPAVDELRRLMLVDEFDTPNTKGKNTLFGDVESLWSSDDNPDNQDEPYMLFDFMFGYEYSVSTYTMARVRCVSGGEM